MAFVTMKPPRVTVLMTVRNGRRFVEEAVESILAQTLQDFRFLIFDEGSSDGTRDVLTRLAMRDARIGLRFVDHVGKAPSLNAGLQEITTEYVAFMDADDVALPERLARQVAVLDAQPDLFAIGSRVDVIDADGHVTGDGWYVPVGRSAMRLATHERLWMPFINPTVTFRTAMAHDVGPFRSLFPAEDHDFWLRAAEHLPMDNLDEVLLQYRRHDGNATGNRSPRLHALWWNVTAGAVQRRTTGLDIVRGDEPFHLAAWRDGRIPREAYRLLALAYAEGTLLRRNRLDEASRDTLREAIRTIRPRDEALTPDSAHWFRIWLAMTRASLLDGRIHQALRDVMVAMRWFPRAVRELLRRAHSSTHANPSHDNG